MRKVALLIMTVFISSYTANGFADEAKERIYLIQMLNQLDAMQALVIAAQKAQPANTRIQFHYTQFKDANGKLRNGLLEDLQAIRQGIREELDQVPVEPRIIAPINGDYIHSSDNHKSAGS